MKTLKRIFELMCAAASEVVPAAEHLCQCAKCSCNFDKSKAKSSDAGCECPNCGTLLDEKGAAKVEDQAAKEIKADGDVDVDAKNATRQPALEASNPEGINQYSEASAKADDASAKAAYASRDANGSNHAINSDAIHKQAAEAHEAAYKAHRQAAFVATGREKTFHLDMANEHGTRADEHYKSMNLARGEHYKSMNLARGYDVDSANAKPAASLQAGFNGNQHKSAKELAAEHSVAADTASKVAASASKAARGQDPSNKEGLHDSAMTMHTAAKSLHELAAAKHRSAGNEDCAKDHDTAAAGHGNEIQAHKGVIEACGGMAARGDGEYGLEASNPEGINQYTGAVNYPHEKQDEPRKVAENFAAYMKGNTKNLEPNVWHGTDKSRVYVKGTNAAGNEHGYVEWSRNAEGKMNRKSWTPTGSAPGYRSAMLETEGHLSNFRADRQKVVDSRKLFAASKPTSASDATPAAGLQLDCSACVEAKNFKSVLNPIADGIIMYMPSGTHTITPSQNGRPVTVSVAIDASAAEKLETQRQALEAGGKKPFFSVQHSTQIAAFWPAEFFWDTRLDATGSLVEGVWARGEWTRAGREAVEGKDFRTFSPTFFVDAIRNDPNRPVQVVCNDEAKANMGALENDPAFQTISPLWAGNASDGQPKPKPEGVTTEKLIVMVHDELRASNPDLQDVVNAMSFKYDMRVTANDVARALRGEALEAGGPGSGPHPGYAAAKEKAEASSKEAHEDTAKISGEGTSNEHHIAGNLHSKAAFEHRGAAFAAQDDKTMKEHLGTAKEHDQKAQSHYEKASAISGKALPKYPAPSKP
jgi:hypothetical protein